MLECKTTSLEVSLIQASTTNEVTMWQRGGPHCLCIVEGQCSASPVIWTWEGEAKEELFNSAGRGLRTVEERDCWEEGKDKNKTPEGGRFLKLSKFC